jgi:hypothetical protein
MTAKAEPAQLGRSSRERSCIVAAITAVSKRKLSGNYALAVLACANAMQLWQYMSRSSTAAMNSSNEVRGACVMACSAAL